MSWYEELDRWTADYLPDMIYEHDAALAKYTSFRIGGPARRMAFPKDGSQMVLLIEAARGCGARPLVIGNGTNLLFPDDGVRTLRGEELRFSYRHSLLTDRPEAVVLRVVFQLTAGRPEEIRQKMEELMTRRKTSQPLEYPSAGSTFKRPEGYFAAALIDQCGLKGMTVGGAQVSEKHAGFVINRGGATCADVTALMAVIQRRVWEEKGVRLEPEIKMIH